MAQKQVDISKIIENVGAGKDWYKQMISIKILEEFRDFLYLLSRNGIELDTFHEIAKVMGKDLMLFHRDKDYLILVSSIEIVISLIATSFGNNKKKRIPKVNKRKIPVTSPSMFDDMVCIKLEEKETDTAAVSLVEIPKTAGQNDLIG